MKNDDLKLSPNDQYIIGTDHSKHFGATGMRSEQEVVSPNSPLNLHQQLSDTKNFDLTNVSKSIDMLAMLSMHRNAIIAMQQ